ncbi:unnamed protein product [Angiostrongylus costaricensis]|uniref:Uncharacterized protein n=1 Tax=Angiostrongylus costaricensis TaxID=334426 RepID=A0A0R3PG71_ANGCS|nr:unnamed protein product [Angiostrongylus costaricensis]
MEPDLGPMPQAVDDYVIPEESLLGSCSGVEMVPSSEFVTPLSPTKRFGARIAEDSMIPPESPDMKFARNRLGTLLTSIRQGETPWLNPIDKKQTWIYVNVIYTFLSVREELHEHRRGPGRPRKVQNKDKQMVFELRGKPFELRDGRKDSMYQLCRAWVRGKSSEPCEPQMAPSPPGDASLDLLVMRDIVALPRARSPYPEESEWPDKANIDQFDSSINPADMDALRSEYARHWKQVKAGWKSHTRRRAQRYHRSIRLLETVYHINQDTGT